MTEKLSNRNMESERKDFVEKQNFIAVNEILSYGITNGDLHIHLAPAFDLSVIAKIRMIEDGFEKLAIVINSKPEVKEISAVSWIVFEKPKLIESLGFKIDDSSKTKIWINSKRLENSLRGRDSRPAARAVMLRQEFLEKYLKN